MESLRNFMKIALLTIVVAKDGKAKTYKQHDTGLQSIPNITSNSFTRTELKGNAITSIQAYDLQHVPNIVFHYQIELRDLFYAN